MKQRKTLFNFYKPISAHFIFPTFTSLTKILQTLPLPSCFPFPPPTLHTFHCSNTYSCIQLLIFLQFPTSRFTVQLPHCRPPPVFKLLWTGNTASKHSLLLIHLLLLFQISKVLLSSTHNRCKKLANLFASANSFGRTVTTPTSII